jgi:ABC-type spermidine/putrescine transport system permease subunit I
MWVANRRKRKTSCNLSFLLTIDKLQVHSSFSETSLLRTRYAHTSASCCALTLCCCLPVAQIIAVVLSRYRQARRQKLSVLLLQLSMSRTR